MAGNRRYRSTRGLSEGPVWSLTTGGTKIKKTAGTRQGRTPVALVKKVVSELEFMNRIRSGSGT